MENTQAIFQFEMSFYKVLYTISKKTAVYLKVPDILLLGLGFESPTLFTTLPETGRLIIQKKVVPEAVKEIFLYFAEQETDPVFPIAVFKTGISNDQSHSKVLFTANECQEKWSEASQIGKAVQKFIHNNNTLAIIQASWDNFESKLTVKEIVKHKNIKIVNESYKKMAASTKKRQLTKEIRTKALRDMYLVMENDVECKVTNCVLPEIERKMMYLVNIFERFYLVDPNLKILTFDADWIEDSVGEIYLLSIKKYRVGQIKAVKQNLSFYNVPNVSVKIPKVRASINFKKKLKNQTNKFSKSCTLFSVINS